MGFERYVRIPHPNVKYESINRRARYPKHSEYYCHDCTNYTLTRHGPTRWSRCPGPGRYREKIPEHVHLSSSSSLARRRAANKLVFINKDHSILAALTCEVR